MNVLTRILVAVLAALVLGTVAPARAEKVKEKRGKLAEFEDQVERPANEKSKKQRSEESSPEDHHHDADDCDGSGDGFFDFLLLISVQSGRCLVGLPSENRREGTPSLVT